MDLSSPLLQPRAYITDGEHLWRVVRSEISKADGGFGHRIWIEECLGHWHEESHSYLYRQEWRGAVEVLDGFRLAKAAPAAKAA
jgi:hypothetical protein